MFQANKFTNGGWSSDRTSFVSKQLFPLPVSRWPRYHLASPRRTYLGWIRSKKLSPIQRQCIEVIGGSRTTLGGRCTPVRNDRTMLDNRLFPLSRWRMEVRANATNVRYIYFTSNGRSSPFARIFLSSARLLENTRDCLALETFFAVIEFHPRRYSPNMLFKQIPFFSPEN